MSPIENNEQDLYEKSSNSKNKVNFNRHNKTTKTDIEQIESESSEYEDHPQKSKYQNKSKQTKKVHQKSEENSSFEKQSIPKMNQFLNIPLHKNLDIINAIGNQLKEQKNNKSEILDNIFQIQKQKNDIISEMKEREERQLEKIEKLEYENEEMKIELAKLKTKLEYEQTLNIENKKQISSNELELKRRNLKVEEQEKKIYLLENEKESMTEIIKKFITKNNESIPKKRNK